jgi:predicted RNA binding protein YcfA (HicA-like mRNA interferase family)
MNRKKLERWLKQNDCFFHRQGGNHEIWMRPGSTKGVPVPRHSEIKPETVANICRSLGIPKPPEK